MHQPAVDILLQRSTFISTLIDIQYYRIRYALLFSCLRNTSLVISPIKIETVCGFRGLRVRHDVKVSFDRVFGMFF